MIKKSFLTALAIQWMLPLGFAVTPGAELGIMGGGKVLVAPAAFGDHLPSSSKRLHLTVVKPSGYQDGCKPVVQVPTHVESSGFALLVQRSPNCTFGERAVAAQGVGAKALIVANSVEGIYRNRSHGEEFEDYDCSNGEGFVESALASGGKLAGFPTSSCATDAKCASKRCLLTDDLSSAASSSSSRATSTLHRVCCAWDTYMTMAATTSAASVSPFFFFLVGAA